MELGQPQEFEASSNQVLSLSVTPASGVLALVMTLDSVATTTTAPGPAPDVGSALGLRLSATMTPDGKVASSTVTDRAGAPSTSAFAGNMRSILPRLKPGATRGATWVDSSTYVTRQNDADITTTTVVTYQLAGDTVVAGGPAWKILGASATKLSGRGSRMGGDYTITGDVTGSSTSVVSAAGVLVSQDTEASSNLTVTVEAASMTIPIVQKTTTRIARLP